MPSINSTLVHLFFFQTHNVLSIPGFQWLSPKRCAYDKNNCKFNCITFIDESYATVSKTDENLAIYDKDPNDIKTKVL